MTKDKSTVVRNIAQYDVIDIAANLCKIKNILT